MAKRIKIDFTKTEERSGWNTRQIPEGLYKAKVAAVQETEAQDGTAMLVYAFVPEDSRFKSRRFPYYCKLQQNQLWKLRDLLVAAGETVPKRAVQIDPEKIVGKSVAIEVEDDSYNGNVRSSVNGVYSVDILDEDAVDSEPEDDEEYEEDDYDETEEEREESDDRLQSALAALAESGEELEESDDDGDYDEEDYEDDESEEDFDEEEEELFEDDDEDYDDEEEEDDPEPEPAPKRRTPARKPAPAKAPAARRTVKRR